jgi:hypothetical protein
LRRELRGVFAESPDLRPQEVKLFAEVFSSERELPGLFFERFDLVGELSHLFF